MEFYCSEKKCPYKEDAGYVLKIPQEACPDEHNYATIFCPHCHSQLIKRESPQE
jgi:hypothetical protein